MSEDLERKRLRQIKNARRKREVVAVYKLMKGCIDCGYNAHASALVFDHIDPTTKTRTVASLMYHSWDRIKKEMDLCEVRCANCHAIK